MSQKTKKAIIIGAGPAGLTAAYELLEKSEIQPIVFEMSDEIGGISKTVNYKGNRIDIGGHRFFSKSDRVMDWWTKMMPVETRPDQDVVISYQNKTKEVKLVGDGPSAESTDLVMLIRSRLSRIFYLRSFFNYPISLSIDTIRNLGLLRMTKILWGYMYAVVFPIKNEKTLEDFLINRFGKELYHTFFKDYTEKVWGTKCSNISAEWGAQRIKGLSITKTLIHAAKKLVKTDRTISQKNTETSLIEQFFYPKLGPGQMWEETARQVKARGGEVHMKHAVRGMKIIENRVVAVTVFDQDQNQEKTIEGDYFFSTMPIKELVASIEGDKVPNDVKEVAEGLVYRDFITVGLLLNKLCVKTKRNKTPETMVKDNWIYIQEPDVKVGRLQIFNNWSPYMVKDENTVWIGMEYFTNEGEELWEMQEDELKKFAVEELQKINIIDQDDVLDSTVIRVPKTYPAYFGTYNRFDTIIKYVEGIENLYLIGRNGMHKYNNQDHSMLTAMHAVENIINGVSSKSNLWAVNTEEEYHEEEK